jgi:alkyl hydroperoxide reductase subunit AhpC
VIVSLRINQVAPDFTAVTTHGDLSFHEWLGDSWAVLFSHPKDFTPVCTTELGAIARIEGEFTRRGVKLIGLSVDGLDNHLRWATDIAATQGAVPGFPIIADSDLAVAKRYDMLPADDGDSADGRTALQNATVRSLFIIGPDRRIKLVLTYPMATGRNFDEVLRVIDALQMTARHQVATPADWKAGDDVIILPAVSDEDARTLFPGGWRAPLPYIRLVPQPR